MKNKENDSPLINGKTKALIGLLVAGGLLLSLLKFILKLAFTAGLAFLVYGIILLIQGGQAASVYLFAGAGTAIFSFFMLKLIRFLTAPGSKKPKGEKPMTAYDHSVAVLNILKDARYVATLCEDNYECNGHGMAYTGSKHLYRGSSGEFIVHVRLYRGYDPAAERVLALPAAAAPADYLDYEQTHEADYSPWYDKIRVDIS